MTAPSTTYPSFGTPEQLTQLLGHDAPDSAQLLLDAASATVRSYCGWHIAPVLVEDLVLDGHGGRTLSLPTLRLLQVLGCMTQVPGSEPVAVPVADLAWSTDGYLRMTSVGRYLRSVGVSIEHGYRMEDVADLTTLVLSVAARGSVTGSGVSSQTVGSVSVTYTVSPTGAGMGALLYPDELLALDRYRLFRRA